jgi:hypothetical protein
LNGGAVERVGDDKEVTNNEPKVEMIEVVFVFVVVSDHLLTITTTGSIIHTQRYACAAEVLIFSMLFRFSVFGAWIRCGRSEYRFQCRWESIRPKEIPSNALSAKTGIV